MERGGKLIILSGYFNDRAIHDHSPNVLSGLFGLVNTAGICMIELPAWFPKLPARRFDEHCG